MSFSVSDGRGGFEFSGTPWGLFARPSHLLSPTFLRMLREWRRFNRLAPGLIGMNGTAPSLGHWLEREGFSRHFIDRLIVPQASAVWSADPEQMWSFPASFMAEFFDNHGMYSLRDRPRWRTVEGGSRSYVEAITAPWRDRVRTAAPVRRIERLPDEVRIEADGCETESFDRVVIAAHSDQALAMLGDPSEAEREVLGAIPYQPNEAVLHTDASADAAPPRRLVELELPPRRAGARAHHRHLLDEPPAATARAAAVLPHPEPGRGDRPGQGPAQLRLRPPRLHRRRGRRAAPPRRGQRGEPHPLLRRLLGLGLPRGRCGERAAGLRGAGRGGPGPRRDAGGGGHADRRRRRGRDEEALAA